MEKTATEKLHDLERSAQDAVNATINAPVQPIPKRTQDQALAESRRREDAIRNRPASKDGKPV